jgi:hypothetical protein
VRKSDSAGWNTLVADCHLVSGNKANAKAIAACETEATKFHKAQDCRITIPAGK